KKLLEAEQRSNEWLEQNKQEFINMVSSDKQLQESGFDQFGIEQQDEKDQLIIGDTKGAFGETDAYFSFLTATDQKKRKRDNPFSATSDNLASNIDAKKAELSEQDAVHLIKRVNTALKAGNVTFIYFLAGKAKISDGMLKKVERNVKTKLKNYIMGLGLSKEEASEVMKNVTVTRQNI
ncbi:MAG: hypothetical protein AB3N14_08680, partial [Flavobacteriaceae bacterium]